MPIDQVNKDNKEDPKTIDNIDKRIKIIESVLFKTSED